MSLTRITVAVLILSGVFASAANATSITCSAAGNPERQATLSGAIDCKTMTAVSSTPTLEDVQLLFGGDWIAAGSLSTDGTDDWLTGVVTAGSWGEVPASGTWQIGEGFWSLYPRAVISFNVANAGGDPDWFFFEIGPGAIDGVFSLDGTESSAGLSNMTLWADPPSDPSVPEPATLALLGTGLLGGALALRRRKSNR